MDKIAEQVSLKRQRITQNQNQSQSNLFAAELTSFDEFKASSESNLAQILQEQIQNDKTEILK